MLDPDEGNLGCWSYRRDFFQLDLDPNQSFDYPVATMISEATDSFYH